MRSLATSIATAALTAGVANWAGLDTSYAQMLDHFKDRLSSEAIAAATLNTAGRTVIDFAGGVLVNTTIGGQSFSAAVQSGLQGGIASFVGEIGANYIGEIGSATAGQNIARYALHGVLGCGIGAIQGDCAAGAIGAVAGEAMGHWIGSGSQTHPYLQTRSTEFANLAGVIAAVAAGRDGGIGGMAGENAYRNNQETRDFFAGMGASEQALRSYQVLGCGLITRN